MKGNMWFDAHPVMLVKLVVSALLGVAVGYERERRRRPAGVRTHAMVALGAALFTIVSRDGFAGSAPARVAAQIVAGVGFLGAGTILHRRSHVSGLAIAASIWVTAALGMAVGVGMITMSIATMAIVVALLHFTLHVTGELQPSAERDGSASK